MFREWRKLEGEGGKNIGFVYIYILRNWFCMFLVAEKVKDVGRVIKYEDPLISKKK